MAVTMVACWDMLMADRWAMQMVEEMAHTMVLSTAHNLDTLWVVCSASTMALSMVHCSAVPTVQC